MPNLAVMPMIFFKQHWRKFAILDVVAVILVGYLSIMRVHAHFAILPTSSNPQTSMWQGLLEETL